MATPGACRNGVGAGFSRERACRVAAQAAFAGRSRTSRYERSQGGGRSVAPARGTSALPLSEGFAPLVRRDDGKIAGIASEIVENDGDLVGNRVAKSRARRILRGYAALVGLSRDMAA